MEYVMSNQNICIQLELSKISETCGIEYYKNGVC
jgi:hypothetical protein